MKDLIKRLDCVRFQPFDGVVVYRDENGNEETLWDVITSAIDTIESLVSENNRLQTESKREVAKSQWIPVTERLPDVTSNKSGYEQVYVIATDGKHVRPMIYERACPRGKTVYRWKWIWDRIYDGNPITHWMSLPKPPKGGSRYDRNYPV